MNEIKLYGRLTKEPDVRMGQKKVARFTVAVKRAGDKDTADFINCVAFDKTADFVERYLRKGKRAIVEANIRTGSYEKDGKRVYTTDVVAYKVTAIDYEPTEYAQPQAQPKVNEIPSNKVGNPMANITPNYSQQMRTNIADQEWSGSSLDIIADDLPF